MYYVYLLQSDKKLNEFYLGSTNDLKRRMGEHNDRKSASTARYTPWKLIYYEAFRIEKDAHNREQKLKHHGKGMKELKKRLQQSIYDNNKQKGAG